MTIKQLLNKIRKEDKEIRQKIKDLENEIKIKENSSQVITNTLWEKSKLRRLREAYNIWD